MGTHFDVDVLWPPPGGGAGSGAPNVCGVRKLRMPRVHVLCPACCASSCLGI